MWIHDGKTFLHIRYGSGDGGVGDYLSPHAFVLPRPHPLQVRLRVHEQKKRKKKKRFQLCSAQLFLSARLSKICADDKRTDQPDEPDGTFPISTHPFDREPIENIWKRGAGLKGDWRNLSNHWIFLLPGDTDDNSSMLPISTGGTNAAPEGSHDALLC